MFPLFSLPNELISAVVEAVDDHSTLAALAQTCRKLQGPAEAQLFRSVVVMLGPEATRLAEVLERRPERFRLVETLEATPQPYRYGGIEVMPELVGRMVRLRRLKIESPVSNSRLRRGAWWEGSVREYMKLFEMKDGPFGNLTSFTLHPQGTTDPYYDAAKIAPIFMSHTLKYIHISCATFYADTLVPLLEAAEGRTPLQTLILESYIFRREFYTHLKTFLSLPRALRSLTLLPCPDESDELEHVLGALQWQSSSLEYLCYICASLELLRTYEAHGPMNDSLRADHRSRSAALCRASTGLSSFHQLHTLDVDYRSTMASVLFNPRLAPPALQSLGVFGIDYEYVRSWRGLGDIISDIAAATAFAHLRLLTEPSHWKLYEVYRLFTDSMFTHTMYREVLLGIAEALRAKTTSMQLICKYGRTPPYLHGEAPPVEKVFFDSERYWSEEEGAGFEPTPYTPVHGIEGRSPARITDSARWQ